MNNSEVNWGLIVHRLDAIVKSQDEFKEKLEEISETVTKIETIKHSVDELKTWKKNVEEVMPVTDMKAIVEWKKKIDDVVSPTQLEDHIKDIDKLKTFKTRSTMIWTVVQGIILLLYFLNEAFGIFKPH